MDFIVIDTEGTRELREIAIINSAGKLIYEAFNQEHPEYIYKTASNKLLKSILLDFTAIALHKIKSWFWTEPSLSSKFNLRLSLLPVKISQLINICKHNLGLTI
ncbi:MAG: hypothetical protein WBM44_14545 [Waterburya sp.]